MRILIYGLNYAPEPVGIGKYSGELGGWLVERGHKVRVVTSTPYFPQWRAQGNRYRMEWLGGALVLRCPIWVPRSPSGMTRIIHLASFALSSLPILLWQWRWKPDLIFCVAPSLFCAPGALVLKKICGKQTCSWLHIQDFELDAAFELGILRGKKLRRKAKHTEQWILASFQRVSSISEAMKATAISKGVNPERSLLLSNWVDLDLIKHGPQEQRNENPYRRELAIRQDQLVLLYSGSMNQKQGLEVIVAAMEKLKDREDLVWVMGGEGPGKAALVKATANLKQVHHLNLQPTERLNDWLNCADIHLLPQKAEAADLVLPSKVLGILASGRPMVAATPAWSTLGKLAEQAGRRVDAGNTTALINAIQELAESREERQKLGTRGRRIAENSYGKENILRAFEQQALKASYKR